MAKLSKTQQNIIDTLRDGGTLEVMYYTHAPSVWVLTAKEQNIGVTIRQPTITKLIRNRIIRTENNYPHWPMAHIAVLCK